MVQGGHETGSLSGSVPWHRRTWVYVAAGFALVGVVAVVGYYAFGRTERPFVALTTVAATPYRGDPVGTGIEADRGYFAYQDDKGELHLRAVDLATGKTQEQTGGRAHDWQRFSAHPTGLVIYAAHATGTDKTLHVYDPTTLEEVYAERVTADTWHFFVGERLIRVEPERRRLVWIDPHAQTEVGEAPYGSSFYRVGNWSDEKVAGDLLGHRFQQEYPDNRLVTMTSDGTMRVLSAENGQQRKETTIPALRKVDRAVAYQGLFFVAGPVSDGEGWQVVGHDIDKLTERPVYADERDGVRPERMEPCGEAYLCVLTSAAELVVVDFKSGQKVWSRPLARPAALATIVPVGNRIMVSYRDGGTAYTVLYDLDGTLVRRSQGWGAPIDTGSVLLFPDDVATVNNGRTSLTDAVIGVQLRGIGAQTGAETDIGAANVNPATCSWDAAYLLCAGSTRLLVHRFR
ncbi:MAG: PQQ-binding-like beta-propeller repeat protein [Micromonosporaceae bacterium]